MKSFLVVVPLAAVCIVAACRDDDPSKNTPLDAGSDVVDLDVTSVCPTGYLGDPTKEIEVELRTLTPDGTDVPLLEGQDVAVLFPPQGGRVAFVGARLNNIDGCGLQFTGALRDPDTKQVRLDGRTLNLRREDDGWGTTGRGSTIRIEDSDEIGDYSNIPLCPNQWASRDVFDTPFELEVIIVDRRKKMAKRKIMVVPRCSEPGAREMSCRCLCRNGYTTGETCGEDAGVDAAAF